MKAAFESKTEPDSFFSHKLIIYNIFFFFFEAGGVLFQVPVTGKPAGRGAGSGEEEVSHDGDPTEELRTSTSRRGEPKRPPPAGDGGILQDAW